MRTVEFVDTSSLDRGAMRGTVLEVARQHLEEDEDISFGESWG